MNIKQVLAHTALVYILTFIGGFVVGLLVSAGKIDASQMGIVIALSNFLMMIIGFTISGALAPIDRFKHLTLVAVLLWLISVTNVLFFGIATSVWLASAIALFVAMGIGGALSFLFVRAPESTDEQPD